ncbi:MAG: cytochrome P460 family protein [Betaproteobacteria bacterium]|nr:cytochrome P460 family protein [Betaproteobacteria bacterium]
MRHRLPALALLALLPAPPISALEPADAARKPPVLATCAGCHGVDGASVAAHIPNLAAQPPAYLAAQIEAFRSGNRKSDVMAPIAKALDASQVAGITAYYGSLPGAAPGVRSAKLGAFATKATFPEGYPDGFSRYHALEAPEQGRVTVFLANAAARDAAKAGRELPEGSVVMSVTHEAVRDAKGEPRRGDRGELVPGKALAYAIMARGPGWGAAIPEIVRNGDWHYALLDGERKPRAAANHAECLACHKPLAAASYVFTLEKLAAP